MRRLHGESFTLLHATWGGREYDVAQARQHAGIVQEAGKRGAGRGQSGR